MQARSDFQSVQVPQFIDAIACLATEIAEEECQLDPQLHDSSLGRGRSRLSAPGFHTLLLQSCPDQKAKVASQ